VRKDFEDSGIEESVLIELERVRINLISYLIRNMNDYYYFN